jgi:diguanylate cyclase (GGDEF)-like protein/PAS domain S-box-containing protein
MALVLVVQGEGGVVLGLPGGLWAWAVIGAISGAIEGTWGGRSGMPVEAIEVAIPQAVGLLLALGGGSLSEELLGERRRRAEEREVELKLVTEAEARYRALVEQIPVVAYIDAVDRSSSTIYISPRIEALLGNPAEAWTADPGLWETLLHPEDRARVLDEHHRTNATGEPFRAEYRMTARDGRVVWVRDEAVLLRDAGGTPLYWQGVLAEITEAKRVEERLAFLAYHDKLTGLPDRALVEQELILAVARAKRHRSAVGVLFLDLDRFKAVNDRFGHAGGDEVLRVVATRLPKAVRETDLVTRHGGDEFLVLLADLDRDASEDDWSSAEEVPRSIAERIHHALAAPIPIAREAVHPSASIGISIFPRSPAEELLKQADAAMYRSKREGPGGTRVFGTQPD